MWSHIFICKQCGHEVKMVTEDMANPMRDRVGLHMSLFEEGAAGYYHGATISLLQDKDKRCPGILMYQNDRLHQEIVKEAFNPNAKVTEGALGKVTEELWRELPEELQKKLGTVLNNAAPPQGGQGIKQLAGSPKFKGVTYTYELKFLGAYGNHRCYGNKVGAKVEFTVYDPNGSLH